MTNAIQSQPDATQTTRYGLTPASLKNGETVTFTKTDGTTAEGYIQYISWMALTKQTTYFVKSGNRTYACRREDIVTTAPLMDADTYPVLEEKPAPVIAQRTYTHADVRRLEQAWWAAQDAPKSLEEAVREPHASKIANAHTAFQIAQAVYLNNPAMMPCDEDIQALEASLTAQITVTTAAPADVTPVDVQTAAPAPLFSKEAQLSPRDREVADRHIKAAVEQFGLKDLPAPAEKQDWRVEYPSLIAVQQHRLNQARKAE